MKRIVRIAALTAIAALTIAAAKANWLATVRVTDNGGHVLGNPDAKVKLTEYLSYTCSHCAKFHKEGDGAVKLAYIQPGKASLEIQHFVRDPVDLTVAMLTNCGKPGGFFLRHSDFMGTQDKWLGKLDSMSEAQKARWTSGTVPSRLQAVARDFGFYQMMERRGFSASQVNRCLTDEAMTKRLTAQRVAADEFGVQGTPSFAINGSLLEGTHDWKSLQEELAERF